MLALVLSAISVFAAAALLVAGQMLLGTQLSLSLSAAGYGSTHISLVLLFNSLGFMLGSLMGPRLIGRVGHIRVFSAFAAVMCCCALAHGAYVNDVLWAALRALTGFCGALLLIVLESWINAHATPQRRGRLMSLYMVNYYLAGAGGQLFIGVFDTGDARVFMLAAGLIVMASVPLSLTSRPAPPIPASGRLALRVDLPGAGGLCGLQLASAALRRHRGDRAAAVPADVGRVDAGHRQRSAPHPIRGRARAAERGTPDSATIER